MPTLSMSALGVKRTSLIRSLMSANDPKRTFDLHSSAAAEGNLTRIRVVEAPQRAEDIFEFVGLFPSVAQHLYHPLQ